MSTTNNTSPSNQNNTKDSLASIKCEWTHAQEAALIEHLPKTQRNNKSNKGFSKLTWSAIANELKGTEGDSKIKTGDMKDANDLLKKSGAGWNPETNLIELSSAIKKEMAEKQGAGKVDSFSPENNTVKEAGKSNEDDLEYELEKAEDEDKDGENKTKFLGGIYGDVNLKKWDDAPTNIEEHQLKEFPSTISANNTIDTLKALTEEKIKSVAARSYKIRPLLCIDHIDIEASVHTGNVDSTKKTLHGTWGYMHVPPDHSTKDLSAEDVSLETSYNAMECSKSQPVNIHSLLPTDAEEVHFESVRKSQLVSALLDLVLKKDSPDYTS
ncbi:hypothetical protein DFH28DRAFT_1129073 [Melampsora americana]|nr:hypothetical protein DFH28DRAFT_1129073 [Melampsora americana]